MFNNCTFVTGAQMQLSDKPTLSLAPMMDYTDRHMRYLIRLMSQHALLYTEMVTTGAILHGNRALFLKYHPLEHPLALQLGGSDPTDLAAVSRIANDQGFDEINLNIGCPSDRVQKGRFGACLMAEPELVAECIHAMQKHCQIPVTVKTRIGIDDHDSYAFLTHFIDTVAATGCNTFIIHARKAWLQGLSPKENRTVPPLSYDSVYDLKKDYPHLNIQINGGIQKHEQIQEHLKHVDGVMLGRVAVNHPYLFAEIDQRYFNVNKAMVSREEILNKYIDYAEKELQEGAPLRHLTKPLLGLYKGQPGARKWRQVLSQAFPPTLGLEIIQQALAAQKSAITKLVEL